MAPTRRAILAATAPIAADMALAPLVRPAQALAMPANPDAPLFVLRDRWRETLAAFNDALEAKDAADSAMFAALREAGYPEWPPVDHPDYAAEIERVAEQRGRASKAISAEIEASVKAAKAAENATSAANRAVVDEIAAMPARTLEGVAFKVKVSEDWLHGHEALIDSLTEDITAFAAAHPTLTI